MKSTGRPTIRTRRARRRPVASLQSEALKNELGRLRVVILELQHRARNLMAVIRTLASRTMAETCSSDDFIEAFDERLAALARVQDLLTRGETQAPITLGELVEAELRAIGYPEPDRSRERICVSATVDVQLPAASAQVLALVLHELATNALKYGALRHEGQVSIGWDVQGSGARERVRLEWQETCPVSIAPPSAGGGGYGRELIERALPFQFGAKTRYEFKPDGVHCTIHLPLDAGPQARS